MSHHSPSVLAHVQTRFAALAGISADAKRAVEAAEKQVSAAVAALLAAYRHACRATRLRLLALGCCQGATCEALLHRQHMLWSPSSRRRPLCRSAAVHAAGMPCDRAGCAANPGP